MIEKERKFLMKKLPALEATNIYGITQFYKDGYRYRVTHDKTDFKFVSNPKYERIKKTKLSKGVNNELEITEIDYRQFYEVRASIPVKERREITKTRNVYDYGDKKFEVDVFQNMSLVMMEVEDTDIDEAFTMPEEIEKMVLMEVTGNDKFDNYNLAI